MIFINKQIKEVIYLSTENFFRYRTIIRILFYKYEQMRYWLSTEEIFEEIKNIDDFFDYTLENLKQDLSSLENWGNLISIQDTSKTKTLEEFKNRKFRYQISQITVSFERTLIELENQGNIVKGSLETSLIERFRDTLKEIDSLDNKNIYGWWQNINNDFKQLNENYQDYISKFDFLKLNDLSKVTEFLIFKDNFVKYLRKFIIGIQENSILINEILLSIKDEYLDDIIKKIIDYENDIQNSDDNLIFSKFDIYKGRFLSMKNWFISTNGQASMVDILLDKTNEIIRKITRFALQIVEMNNVNTTRKEEYKKIIELFNQSESLDEAHKLSSVVFGVFNTKHIVTNKSRQTESLSSSIFDENPENINVVPKVNNYREKTSNRVVLIDNKENKEKLLDKILKKRKIEQEKIDKKIKGNSLKFSELDILSSDERKIFLSWLSLGLNKGDEWIKNEYGHLFKIKDKNPKNNIVLKCVDGNFNMPDFEIIFKKEENY